MTNNQPLPLKVQWLPAHPSYGSISMERYAALLAGEVNDSDLFSPYLLINPHAARKPFLNRQFQRRIGYPLKIASNRDAQIVHVLDHSWTDMLRFCGRGVKKVVTLHDLIPLRFPGELKPSQVKRFRQWVSYLHEADAIISVSEYTKREAVEYLGLPPERIHVVPNGVNLPPSGIAPPQKSSDRFYIGSIGSVLERKNLSIFVQALRRLKEMTTQPFTLVRVGPPLPQKIASALRDCLGQQGILELGRIEDAALPNFYASLDCVVIPSLYEGFGLPVLEGMAARIPVVSSNSSSLTEVGRDVPLYFDPHSPNDLAEILAGLIEHGVPHETIERGFSLASEMSWRKSLEGIYSVYSEILA